MGIFIGLFRSRDKPTNQAVGNTHRFSFGGTTSDKTVTEQTAMQMTAVYRLLENSLISIDEYHQMEQEIRQEFRPYLFELYPS